MAKKESFFWTSYSDLMTSLFFIMLVLFVVSFSRQNKARKEAEEKEAATAAQLAKINELQTAFQNIDTTYFRYDSLYKKHILKINVKFERGSSKITDLSAETRDTLLQARDAIKEKIENLVAEEKKDSSSALSQVSYLLIIEGQASRETPPYPRNNELSYERALALFNLWFPKQVGEYTNLNFFNLPCEVVIAGAGDMDGKPREDDNASNQRFLIQLMPKPSNFANQEDSLAVK